MLFSYGVCVNDTKMILFVENSVRKRLFSTEKDGIIILPTIDDIRYERAFGSLVESDCYDKYLDSRKG